MYVQNNLQVGGILDARVVRGRDAFQGMFTSATALNTYRANPLIGMWAIVLLADRTGADEHTLGEVYYCETDGTWTDAEFTCDGPALIAQLQAEMLMRQSGDATLQQAIDEEKALRIAGDEGLQDAINEEVTNRQEAIAQEVSNRNAAINAAVGAEAELRTEADNDLQRQITENNHPVITQEQMDAVLT